MLLREKKLSGRDEVRVVEKEESFSVLRVLCTFKDSLTGI